MVGDLFSAEEQKGTIYHYIPFSEFVDISSKNLNDEYSIAADDLDGEISINPVHTDKNPFNSTTYSGRSTVYSVHSHVNMLPLITTRFRTDLQYCSRLSRTTKI